MASLASRPVTATHPLKFIWILWAITFNAARLPFWMVYFIPSFLRQNPEWSFKQALLVRITRAFINNLWLIEIKTPTDLKPSKEGDKFAVLQPGKPEKYVGCVARDSEIRPQAIGGTWYPSKPSSASAAGEVVLHFHGGAYVLGDGRTKDTGFAAKAFLENTPASHVFAPQYRLASNPGGRFPAMVQDAITSLLYLTETLDIPANKITISGDSAGGHLCLTLLRYIADNPDAQIPNPGCAWLWSPWVDPQGALVEGSIENNPHYPTDYLTDGFGAWGARMIKPSQASGITLSHPNITFLDTAFTTPTRLFFSVGECEVLYYDILKSYEQFKAVPGNKVDLQIESNAVHDIIAVGPLVGFEKEAILATKGAGKFLTNYK